MLLTLTARRNWKDWLEYALFVMILVLGFWPMACIAYLAVRASPADQAPPSVDCPVDEVEPGDDL